MTKTIGILTSGGDCAGLNAAIRAVVHSAAKLGWKVIGIEDGTHGLLVDPPLVKELLPENWTNTVLRMGGTLLGTTNKGDPFAYPMEDGTLKDRTDEILDNLEKLNIDALICIGGDGSLDILHRLLSKRNVGFIGIPKTIDNDVALTESCIGFDTAVEVATEALDRLQPTAASHDRVMLLEVMGRDAGHIALVSGLAGGADVILIPEIPYDIEKVIAHIQKIKDGGRNYALIVVSEALKTTGGDAMMVKHADGQKRYGGVGGYVANQIFERTGIETRVTVLGHVQRGAAPSHRDRMIATAFGAEAVRLIANGKMGRMVAWHSRNVINVPIEEAVADYQQVDPKGALVQSARAIGICLGDE